MDGFWDSCHLFPSNYDGVPFDILVLQCVTRRTRIVFHTILVFLSTTKNFKNGMEKSTCDERMKILLKKELGIQVTFSMYPFAIVGVFANTVITLGPLTVHVYLIVGEDFHDFNCYCILTSNISN
jgi:hypothetical protein